MFHVKHSLNHYSSLFSPRWWVLIFLGLCLAHTVTTLLVWRSWWLLPLTGLWLFLAWRLEWGAVGDDAFSWETAITSKTRWCWSWLPLALWWVYLYLADSFGQVDMAAVFYHLQAGIGEHGGSERMVDAVLYTLAGLLNLVAFSWLVRHDSRWQRLEKVLALLLLVSNPLLLGVTQRGAAFVTRDGAWLDRRYVEPRIIEAPPRLPNVLYLYLESLEATYADEARFGDAYAPLKALEKRALVFDGVRQLDNTGWTMAGMIASQCGVPLMPAGLIHDSQFEPLGQVVPGVKCLGNLLGNEGYTLSYMGGASTSFAGKGIFYRDHGFDRIRGREELLPLLEDGEYLNSWGLFDDSLFDLVVEEVRELNAGGAPWGAVALTLGAHAPHGYPAKRCEALQGEFEPTDILYSVKCSAWLAKDLIERLERAGLLDDTLVVVASDHLSMKVPVWEELVSGPRRNTLMMLGSGLTPGRIEREATTLDIFPTLLEAMGFTIDRHRAGLGVSLLSPAQTLVERHGLDALNTKLKAEVALQERLWKGLHPRRRQPSVQSSQRPNQVTETPMDTVDDAMMPSP